MFDKEMAKRKGRGLAGYQVGWGAEGTALIVKGRGEWGRDS